MAKSLIVVESPTKARTLSGFLGKEYEIRASYGHVRDLPDNASEIPLDIKKEKWSRLGINLDKDFEPLYIIPENKKKHVSELKKILKDVSMLYLATDEDREGESISWHLLEVLKPKIPVKRLVFHEITKEAINASLKSPRDIDENLVRAQETRRLVDRLFGYSVSPLLWKKMAPRLSAGRVQSVAMRLLVERERERIRFREASYWDIKAAFSPKGREQDSFEAELTHIQGKRIASGKDFIPEKGTLDPKSDVLHLDEVGAKKWVEKLLTERASVTSIEEKPYTTKPSAPFTTSTLQQEGNRKLGLSARRTMSVAQSLYENGFITYMRTDSTTLSEEALNGARALISNEFGEIFLSPEPRLYQTKVKNAQEAHEAIRPAGASFVSISEVQSKVGPEAARLYELIWKRTLASQMKDAQGLRVVVQVKCGDAQFRASGKTILFPGFLRAYVEGSDDPDAEIADMEKILPKLKEGEELDTKSLDSVDHKTQPPARYTEGSLIKELERLGIGRPSTWATIVDVVLQRQYAFKRGTALVPSFLATAVTGLMEGYFPKYLDYAFTARLEDDLDAISRGEADGTKYLKSFYFGNGNPGLKDLVKDGEEKIDPRVVCGIALGVDAAGTKIEVRIGRFGPFLTNGTDRASLADDIAPDEMTIERAQILLEEARRGPAALGDHPSTGEKVYLKKGRFGPYIQLGEPQEGIKPKMASLLPKMTPDEVTLDIAVKLLTLPATIGKHPENGEDIIVANGRFGPYIKCGTDTRSIPYPELSPISITIEQVVEILKQPKTSGRASRQSKKIKDLGKHPLSESLIVVKTGYYGPYVTDGKLNATIPKDSDPMAITLEEAVGLLEARAIKIGSGGGGRRRAPKKEKKAKAEPAKGKPAKAKPAKEKPIKEKTPKAKKKKSKN